MNAYNYFVNVFYSFLVIFVRPRSQRHVNLVVYGMPCGTNLGIQYNSIQKLIHVTCKQLSLPKIIKNVAYMNTCIYTFVLPAVRTCQQNLE